MTIYKYQIEAVAGHQKVRMPSNHKILSAQLQHGMISIWADVEPDCETVHKTFVLIETGDNINSVVCSFVTTIQLRGGDYILHLFQSH